METFNNEDRRNLQRLLEKLTELEIYGKQKEKLRTDNTLWYATERIYIKVGELMKNLRRGSGSAFRNNPIFKKLAGFRDILAHKIDTDVEIVISSFDSMSELKKAIRSVLKQHLSEDDILANFEMFSKVGNQEGRQKYVDALSDHLNNSDGEDIVSFPETEELKNISAATKAIISHAGLQELSQNNESISKEILHDIIKWAKELTTNLSRNNPLENEEKLFDEIEPLELNDFNKRFPSLKRQLSKLYDNSLLNLSFYDKKRKELARTLKKEKSKEKQQKIAEKYAALQRKFLEDWSKQLIEKKLKHELQIIDEAREKFTNELYKRIEEYEQLKSLLEPFTKDLGRLWDMSKGIWSKTGFDIVRKYAELLKKDKSLQELASLLGRFRQSEKEYEEELFEEIVIRQDWKIDRAQKSEFIGIRESNDLNALLPAEMALLANPITENIFYKKYAEKKLLTFDYQGRTQATIEEKKQGKRQKAKEEDKGPMIICVDTSGSMHGTPEQIAKVLCFAILKVAMQDNRKCYLISFSTGIQTIELSNIADSIDDLVNFLSHSFSGGTDAKPAIEEAVKMLNTEDYKKSDILLISDFVMPAFSEKLQQEIQQAKEKKTQFHSLTIGKSGNTKVANSFDNNWIYNPGNGESMIQLVKNIRKIQKRK